MKLLLSFGLSLLILNSYFIIQNSAWGQTMENGMYVIQEGDVSTFNFDAYISKDNISAKTKPGEYSGTNYTVKSGNDFNSNLTTLTFSISNKTVDFGSLSPTNPVLRNIKLMVKNNSSYSYRVIGTENNQLTEAKSGAKIPDTTCDEGQCSEAVSGKWESTLAYGFGYRCDISASICALDDESFKETNYYKQFPDSSANESAATILSGGPQTHQEASLTFKVNIPSSQPQGFYSNTVTLLTVPSY